jgi:hypothetical protein
VPLVNLLALVLHHVPIVQLEHIQLLLEGCVQIVQLGIINLNQEKQVALSVPLDSTKTVQVVQVATIVQQENSKMKSEKGLVKIVQRVNFRTTVVQPHARVVGLGNIKINQVKVVARIVHLDVTKIYILPQVARIAQKENMPLALVLHIVQDVIRLNIRMKQVNRHVKHLFVV